MTDAYFTTDDGAWFQPTDFARGPWDPQACHGGPPTSLLVRALEGLADVGPDQSLARLTVELVRPVPMAGFIVTASLRRRGRTATTTAAELVDGDGRVCASATGLHLATVDLATPSAPIPAPVFDRSEPGAFPVPRNRMGGLTFFSHSLEVRDDPPSRAGNGGPTTLWMRTVAIVDREDPSPRQRLGPLADCGNGISWNTHPDDLTCINPDLTLTLLREPVGTWFASRAATHAGPVGIGRSDADLFDVDGLVGHAAQTLVLRAT